MAKVEITEEQFTAYVRVQKSGVTNMFDLNNVKALTGLNKEQCLEIMSNYGKLEEKYKPEPIERKSKFKKAGEQMGFDMRGLK